MKEPNLNSKLDMLDFEDKHPMPYEIALEIMQDCFSCIESSAHTQLGLDGSDDGFLDTCYKNVIAVFAASGIPYVESDYFNLFAILVRYEMARTMLKGGLTLGGEFPRTVHFVEAKKKGN